MMPSGADLLNQSAFMPGALDYAMMASLTGQPMSFLSSQGPSQEMLTGMIGQQMLENPGFADSIAFESGIYSSPEDRFVRMQAMELARQIGPMVYREMMDFELTNMPFFAPLNRVFHENFRFYNSRSWSEQDIRDIENQGLKAFEDGRIKRFFQTMLGEQYATKTEWRARASSTDQFANAKAEALNHILRWVAQESKWQRQKHAVFRDGIIGNRGVAVVYSDPRDPFGRIIAERCRPQEFMWDIYSATDSALSGTRYMWRGYYKSRMAMAVEYPEWTSTIKLMGLHVTGQHYLDQLGTMMHPSVKPPTTDVSGNSYSGLDPLGSYTWRDIVFVREFYRRRQELVYVVFDGYTKTHFTFDVSQREQAAYFAEQRAIYYKSMAAIHGVQLDAPNVSAALPKYVDVVDQCIFCGDTLLRVTRSVLDRFPYHHYIPEWWDGEIQSLFSHGKDAVRIQNRMLTRIDEAAGAIKPKMWVNREAVEQDLGQEELEQNLIDQRKPVYVNVPQGMSIRDVVMMTNSPSLGELPTMLYKMATDSQFEMFGGENAIGMQESSAESGKAVLARRAASQLATIPHFEELENFDLEIAKDVTYRSQFLEPTIRRIVMDPENNRPIVKAIIDSGIQSIDDLDLLLDIAEVSASPTEKDSRSNRINVVLQQDPTMAPYLVPIKLKYDDIDQSDIEQAMGAYQNDKEQNRQMAMMQMQHEHELEKMKLDVSYFNAYAKAKELEIKAMNLPKLQVNYKGSLSPDLEAEFLQKSTIEADGLGVMADKAKQALFDQARMNLMQQSEWENMAPEQKEAFKLDVARKKQAISAKDTRQRETRSLTNQP